MRTDEIEAFSKVDLGGKESILTGTNIRTRVRWLIPISRQGSANWYQYQDRCANITIRNGIIAYKDARGHKMRSSGKTNKYVIV
ncbi:hypothetical protein J6590_091542 [Homalodisca vitripennis]|nr:hypothetical protein J6590_091542 [Homalodisca vitripennis]